MYPPIDLPLVTETISERTGISLPHGQAGHNGSFGQNSARSNHREILYNSEFALLLSAYPAQANATRRLRTHDDAVCSYIHAETDLRRLNDTLFTNKDAVGDPNRVKGELAEGSQYAQKSSMDRSWLCATRDSLLTLCISCPADG